MKSRRLSFTDYDVAHLYELACENFQAGCHMCAHNKNRMERFLGKKVVKKIREDLELNPYNQ